MISKMYKKAIFQIYDIVKLTFVDVFIKSVDKAFFLFSFPFIE